MTCEEMSNHFDTLVSSYRRFKDFDNKENLDSVEFDEYEKSLFLTKAQEEYIISLYSGRNVAGDSFESTEEQRRYLANLVETAQLFPIENTTGILGLGSQSTFFTLPEDVWFITYEAVNLKEGQNCAAYNPMDVYPVTQDDYHKTKRNPFRGTGKRRALRLDLADGVIEIVCKYIVDSYYIRYLKKPEPIILINLPEGLTIENENTQNPCKLHEALHRTIVERAVAEALQSKVVSSKKDNT